MYYSGQAIPPYLHLQIRSSAEFYQNTELQCFVGDGAIETSLQSLNLYNTKLRKTSINLLLKSRENLSVTLGFHY